MKRQPNENSVSARTSRRYVAGLPASLRGQRVVPLPLAMAAVAVPFLMAWASADERRPAEQSLVQAIRGSRAEARPLDEPLVFLGRDVRVPDMEGGYVDIWAVPSGWEAGLLQRRGR